MFAAVQAWCCLSTAVGTCAALHDAARVDADLFSADVRTYAAHFNAVGTYYLFTLLLGSILPLFYSWSWRSTVHCNNAVGAVGTYRHSSKQQCCRRDRLSIVWSVGETALFGRHTVHFSAVRIVCTCGHSSDNAASSTTVDATVPLQCGRWGNCFVRLLY